MATEQIFKNNILKGKVAFVTGGGSGICKGMTEAMLRHGAKAVIISRRFDKLDKAAEEMRKEIGAEVLAIAADVRKPEDIIKAVELTIEKFGRIDILVNGAAGNFLSAIETLSYRAFRTVIEIDLIGTFNTSKACFPHLKKSKGVVINVSANLHYQATLYQSHAMAAKAGVDALTRAMALEWGPHQIRVNGVTPGPIGETVGFAKLSPVDVSKEDISRRMPLQRVGKIRDIEYATLYLASDASSFVTGTILLVDGGDALRKHSILPYPESVLNPFDSSPKKVGAKL
ncbi:2,4-dienoyl-CoA reductase [Gigaspora rosea]|uniref:2,4-dienoyl-CoA reductase [(3E)-enoyl-CoA-producing] n=1 Tax=Gigaspora rosea TaxID=44941 RepID=A0A397VHT4_9GLOM|nr:2,4-dienoyl-CoA reductase [Gigaspora rosea]